MIDLMVTGVGVLGMIERAFFVAMARASFALWLIRH